MPEPTEGRRSRITSHPLVTVAVVSGATAVGHGIWIWTHRRLGAFDPDESGYIAAALRFHRTFDLLHPWEFIRAVGGTGFGPLVPLLGVPLLWIGPDDPRTVLLLQPLLMVVAAVAVAGIVARIATPTAAIAAGITATVIPTMSTAAQTNWLGLGAATSLALALWALLASDRCRTRTTWWFGVGLAAMLLSRTMTIGYLPGVIAAGLVVVRHDRRSIVRLLQALALTAVLAGPWYVVERSAIFGYLTSYGYGRRAGIFGGGNVAERTAFRIHQLGEAIGVNVAMTALVLLAIGVVIARVQRSPAPGDEALRSLAALAVTVALGLAALISTSNNGVWFELPIALVLIAFGAASLSYVRPWLRWTAMAPVVGMALVQHAAAWWLVAPETVGVPWIAVNHLHSTQTEPAFAEYDGRFSTANRGSEVAAAAQWWKLTQDVGTAARRIERTDRPVTFFLAGSMELFNTNTLYLSSQLRGDDLAFHIPDTVQSAAARRRDLTPTYVDRDGRRTERVLVVARHDYILFPADMGVKRFAEQAEGLGWRSVETFDMPGSGRVDILRNTKR